MTWTFRELRLTGEVGVVSKWLDNLRPAVRAKKVRQRFRAMLMGMKPLSQDEWPDEWVTKLKGYNEVFELRFKVLNIPHRPLFFFGPKKGDITFVFPETEEASDEFVPRNAPDQAKKLINQILNGTCATNEIDLDTIE